MAVIPAAEWIDRARAALQSVERGRISGDTQTEVTRLLVADVAPPSDSMDGYQEWTRTTAIYPGAGSGSGVAVLYTALGLCDEAGEVAEKLCRAVQGNHNYAEGDSQYDDLVLRRMALVNRLQFSTADSYRPVYMMVSVVLTEIVNACKKAALLKKAIRGDFGCLDSEVHISDLDRAMLRRIEVEYAGSDGAKSEGGDVGWYHARHIDENGLKASEVAEANIEKLESRKVRNVIKGSGDTR